jgi:MFS superfamily sulfate permease-like transporter
MDLVRVHDEYVGGGRSASSTKLHEGRRLTVPSHGPGLRPQVRNARTPAERTRRFRKRRKFRRKTVKVEWSFSCSPLSACHNVACDRLASDLSNEGLLIFDLEGELFFVEVPGLTHYPTNIAREVKLRAVLHVFLRLKRVRNPNVASLEFFEHFPKGEPD